MVVSSNLFFLPQFVEMIQCNPSNLRSIFFKSGGTTTQRNVDKTKMRIEVGKVRQPTRNTTKKKGIGRVGLLDSRTDRGF